MKPKAYKDLLKSLPVVRGRYAFNVDLSKIVWFRVGGYADVIFKPADVQDLAFFLKEKPADLPYQVIGVGSNLLIRDGGVPGVIIRLGRGFANMALKDSYFDVGAGVLDRSVAMVSQEEGLANLEFLCSIPGTIGGALRMNAGCYGGEIKDVLTMAFALDPAGKLHKLTVEDMGFGYRHTSIPEDWIFVGARLKAPPGNSAVISETIRRMLKEREETQPIHSRTGGSTFANPPEQRAWELIDAAGCRGLKINGALMSPLHCNFMINEGNATAWDLELLGEKVRQRVREKSGIDLAWEIRRIGLPSSVASHQKVA